MPRFLDTVPIVKPKRSSFDLSNRYKFTARFANLIPAVCIPTLPSDHFSLAANFQARIAALINPIYDDITARVEWFFVPNEILWPQWKAFITGNDIQNGSPSTQVSIFSSMGGVPIFKLFRGSYDNYVSTDIEDTSLGNYLSAIGEYDVSNLNVPGQPFIYNGSLADYLGIGLEMCNSNRVDPYEYSFNGLPFLAYQRVFFDYYVNQPTDTIVGDYDNLINQFFEFYSGSFSDLDPLSVWSAADSGYTKYNLFNEILPLRNRAWNKDIFTTATVKPVGDAAVNIDTSSGSISIPQINLARALYRLGYKDNITGGRYDENILAQFGILPSAVEMHRAVFLGSQSYKVNVNGVVQTSATSEVSPQANMAGLGVASGSTGRINYTCHEHGYIIGMFSIMPRSTYAFSTRKDFFKNDRYDFAWPDLAGIGDEEINIAEVWDTNFVGRAYGSSYREDTFGYQQRYYDYKQILDSVHGGFRNFTGDLGAYTMARTAPGTGAVSRPSSTGYKLNSHFVRPVVHPTGTLDAELSRPFADSDIYTGGYHYVCDFYADIRANRPIPEYSLPML